MPTLYAARVRVLCQNCGKESILKQSQINQGRGKFCSRACLFFALRRRVSCLCANCGKEFFEQPGRIKDGRGKYCSDACHYAGKTLPVEARFWRHVIQSDGCWLWNGTDTDYGRICLGKRSDDMPAHIFSYELHYGPVPEGLIVRHKCDKPSCVRPDHLEVGTYKDNTQDAMKRHRLAIGERNTNAKLTGAEVVEIRRKHLSGTAVKVLAREYGVDQSNIYTIVTNKTWKHLL